MKTMFGWLCAAFAVAALGWGGMYLYWHVRIVGAVSTLESKAGTPAADDAVDVVESAGCRALPYLVAALEPQKNQFFQILVSKAVFKSIETLGSRNALPYPGLVETARGWVILPEDDATLLRTKCDAIRTYWRDHGHLHHQSWRVWSSNCGP